MSPAPDRSTRLTGNSPALSGSHLALGRPG